MLLIHLWCWELCTASWTLCLPITNTYHVCDGSQRSWQSTCINHCVLILCPWWNFAFQKSWLVNCSKFIWSFQLAACWPSVLGIKPDWWDKPPIKGFYFYFRQCLCFDQTWHFCVKHFKYKFSFVQYSHKIDVVFWWRSIAPWISLRGVENDTNRR